MPAGTEQREEVFEFQRPYAGDLEFEKGILTRVRVDREYPVRARQDVIESVAPCACDYQHIVVGSKSKCLPVHGGIFPTRVVNKRAGIDGVEDRLIKTISQRKRFFQIKFLYGY